MEVNLKLQTVSYKEAHDLLQLALEDTAKLKARYDLREEVDWAASICESTRWKSGCLVRRRSVHFNAPDSKFTSGRDIFYDRLGLASD